MQKGTARTKAMTEGSIPAQLFAYALPLILGNVFQITYNAVDSVIVGRFLGSQSLAAVGTAGPVMNLFILGISGISMGSCVIMSRLFGAGREDLLKKEVATLCVFGFYFSAAAAVAGMLGTEGILRLLGVPGEIFERTAVYLRLVFLGIPFTYFYNTLSGALKSVGDSRTPLLFLTVASILNALLDIVLIGGLHFGIVCSAWTTVLAQAFSAVWCAAYIRKRAPLLWVCRRQLRLDRTLLGQTLRYGGVTALQQACQPVGNLLIQGAVNTMGVDIMAAFNVVTKVDDYALVPERNISNAMTTFLAQNAGAGKKDRLWKGFLAGMLMEAAAGAALGLLVYGLRAPIIGLFVPSSEPQVLKEGVRYLGLMAFFYILPGMTNGVQGYLRGLGRMKMTLAGTATQTGLRVLFVYLLSDSLGIRSFAVSCAIGWCGMLLLDGGYLLFFGKKERKRQG